MLAPREVLEVDHSLLIREVTPVLSSALDTTQVIWREPSLHRIVTEVVKDGILRDATLHYSVEFISKPYSSITFASSGTEKGLRKRVTIPIFVRDGVIHEPAYFLSSTGKKHALTPYGVIAFLQPFIPSRKRVPRATRALAPERDYRAF